MYGDGESAGVLLEGISGPTDADGRETGFPVVRQQCVDESFYFVAVGGC